MGLCLVAAVDAQGSEEVLVQLHPHRVAGVDADTINPSGLAAYGLVERQVEAIRVSTESCQDGRELSLQPDLGHLSGFVRAGSS